MWVTRIKEELLALKFLDRIKERPEQRTFKMFKFKSIHDLQNMAPKMFNNLGHGKHRLDLTKQAKQTKEQSES